MTLAAECVVAAEAVMDVGSAVVQERVEILFADPFEVFASDPLDDGVVHGWSPSMLTVSICFGMLTLSI
jgi:hypothetical protein